MSPITWCSKIDTGILIENHLPIPRIRREPVQMHTALVIGLVDTIKPRIHNYWQMSIDVEEPNDLLSLPSCVDVQAGYSCLFYRVYRPFYNFCVDGFSRRETVVWRSVRGFNDEDIATFWFRRLCRYSVDAVDVASVHYRLVWSLYEKLG